MIALSVFCSAPRCWAHQCTLSGFIGTRVLDTSVLSLDLWRDLLFNVRINGRHYAPY